MIKTKTIDFKASENGKIIGYASTWTREPDSYGDVVAKGAFTEHIAEIKAEGRKLPFLFNHKSDSIRDYIGSVVDLAEDGHGLRFEADFDATPEGQRARELSMDGRLAKFSFAYDILDQGEITLEDGRKANELRKLRIHEVSLVMYPANPDTSVVSVKAGRRNSAKDADRLRQIISLAQECLGELEDTEEGPKDSEAKSEEPDTANAKEQKKLEELLKEAESIINKKEDSE